MKGLAIKTGEVGLPRYLLLLAAAVLVPLLLGVVFSFVAARQEIKQELETTSKAILHQAESISRQAWQMVSYLGRFKGQSCPEVLPALVRLATLSPYFRSLGLIQGQDMYCSSIAGDSRIPFNEIIIQPLPSPFPVMWNTSLRATRGVKTRPAVMFSEMPSADFGAFAIVDAQYLIDIMSAIGSSQNYLLGIKFGEGYLIEEGHPDGQEFGFITPNHHRESAAHDAISVDVTIPASRMLTLWWQGFITFLPFGLIISFIFVSFVRSWQQRKMSLKDELRKGMLNNEFAVHYQPVYDSVRERCGGAEALLRWNRAGGRSISPEVFITAAESEGLIIPLTLHLFQLLAADVRHWQVPDDFHLGINIAAEHIQHPDFADDIRRLAAQLSPYKVKITLELTERSLISNTSDVMLKLTQLRKEGFLIAIDDFGTGHCSLSYLQTFPLDYLKIDKGFVGTIESAANDTPILDTIISLSKRLKLAMVAEGVSSAEEYQYLKHCGVEYMQGYLYARPMASRQFVYWLQERGEGPMEVAPV